MIQFLDERLPDRFWSKVIPEPNSGCWLWTASLTSTGYGQFGWGGRSSAKAHRVSYSELVGAIPDGLVIDHLCRNTICVNPAHLEAVTTAVNVNRGVSAARTKERFRSITHCPKGHPYTGENLYMYRGGRNCFACRRAGSAFWNRKRDITNAIKRAGG